MGYRTLGKAELLLAGYGPRKGLEGPFLFANGQILYYDPKEGTYWDPKTDWYLGRDEVTGLHTSLIQKMVG